MAATCYEDAVSRSEATGTGSRYYTQTIDHTQLQGGSDGSARRLRVAIVNEYPGHGEVWIPLLHMYSDPTRYDTHAFVERPRIWTHMLPTLTSGAGEWGWPANGTGVHVHPIEELMLDEQLWRQASAAGRAEGAHTALHPVCAASGVGPAYDPYVFSTVDTDSRRGTAFVDLMTALAGCAAPARLYFPAVAIVLHDTSSFARTLRYDFSLNNSFVHYERLSFLLPSAHMVPSLMRWIDLRRRADDVPDTHRHVPMYVMPAIHPIDLTLAHPPADASQQPRGAMRELPLELAARQHVDPFLDAWTLDEAHGGDGVPLFMVPGRIDERRTYVELIEQLLRRFVPGAVKETAASLEAARAAAHTAAPANTRPPFRVEFVGIVSDAAQAAELVPPSLSHLLRVAGSLDESVFYAHLARARGILPLLAANVGYEQHRSSSSAAASFIAAGRAPLIITHTEMRRYGWLTQSSVWLRDEDESVIDAMLRIAALPKEAVASKREATRAHGRQLAEYNRHLAHTLLHC